MSQQTNPGATTHREIRPRHRSIPWPRTSRSCIAASLLIWPVVMLATDIVGLVVEPLAGINDFGLAALTFTLPSIWTLAIVFWCRGVLIHRWSAASIMFAILSLSAWYLFNAIVTFLNFPFGRVNSNF